jgi:superfamily II DNA/RNA helicase
MEQLKTIQPLLSKLKIEALNEMQQSALKAIGGRKDVILLSPTGSGKTLAYLLPLFLRLKQNVKGVQALVVVPSRELAMQIDQVFKQMNTTFLSMSCYGGRSTMEEKRSLIARQPSLIIGTPGRLNDHLNKGNFNTENVHTLVLDEFDKSLELGFQDEMSEVLSFIDQVEKCVLTSATVLEEIPAFVPIKRSTRLDFLTEESDSRLQFMKVESPIKDKLSTLYQLLCTLGSQSTLVFCNYRESVDRVVKYLKEQRFYCEGFHGGMEQEDRERALYKFRSGSCHVLISTDLAARGLDIPSIENVVHYHLPVSEDAFIHRNGRTTRWDNKGKAFTILHQEEKVHDYFLQEEMEDYTLPEKPLKPTQPLWSTLYIGKGKRDKLNKIDIVGFLYKKCQLNSEDIGVIDVRDRYAFVAIKRKKIKQALTLSRGEKIKGKKTIIEEAK